MEEVKTEASVEYVVVNGDTNTDEGIDLIVDIVRHSLRTQFGCKRVTVSIQEYFEPPPPDNGMSYL